MELLDVYDSERHLTGRVVDRERCDLGDNEYILIVNMLYLNSKGEILIQRRAKTKSTKPDLWQMTGGHVQTGEDSFTAAQRESEEELSVPMTKENSRLLKTVLEEDRHVIRDLYLIETDMAKEDLVLQLEEVQDVRWILPEDLLKDEALLSQMEQEECYEPAIIPLVRLSAEKRVTRGRYRHFKGNPYELIDVAVHSETLQPMVVYRALYGDGGCWVRPLSMWNEVIERDGKRVKRFEKV